MTARPSADLRRRVYERAAGRCEYCLIHENDAAARHQIDHVIAEKHGGLTSFENLALSCSTCNRRKGTDIAAVDPANGSIVPLFNPRQSHWRDHFGFRDQRVIGITPGGRATAQHLHLNTPIRIAERIAWSRANQGSYPSDRE